jgi:hypothetical protein
MTTATTRRHRSAGFLLLSAALLGALALVGFTVPQSPLAIAGNAKANASVCKVTYYALDPANPALPNPAKPVPAAFGTPVTARGEQAVKAELNERRECGADGTFDPALTASHYARWSETGLTSIKVGYNEIDAFYAKIAADPNLYNQVVTELKKLEDESTYSEESVPAGIWSLFMVPDGHGSVHVGQGRTSANGTNAVFTHPGGIVVKYRLDCGFQPNQEKQYANVPMCTPQQCPPPTCPPGTTGVWPNCMVPPHVVPPCPPTQVMTNGACHDRKWLQPSPTEGGWNKRGTDNGVTNGQQSSDQLKSGATRGNAGNDQVNTGTVTKDTLPSSSGGPVANGGTPGGDDQTKGGVDPGNTNQDPGGTNGDTCVPDGVVVLTCP